MSFHTHTLAVTVHVFKPGACTWFLEIAFVWKVCVCVCVCCVCVYPRTPGYEKPLK